MRRSTGRAYRCGSKEKATCFDRASNRTVFHLGQAPTRITSLVKLGKPMMYVRSVANDSTEVKLVCRAKGTWMRYESPMESLLCSGAARNLDFQRKWRFLSISYLSLSHPIHETILFPFMKCSLFQKLCRRSMITRMARGKDHRDASSSQIRQPSFRNTGRSRRLLFADVRGASESCSASGWH